MMINELMKITSFFLCSQEVWLVLHQSKCAYRVEIQVHPHAGRKPRKVSGSSVRHHGENTLLILYD